jgi:hypothetical protein
MTDDKKTTFPRTAHGRHTLALLATSGGIGIVFSQRPIAGAVALTITGIVFMGLRVRRMLTP